MQSHQFRMLKNWNAFKLIMMNFMIILLKGLLYDLGQPGMKKVRKTTSIF